MADMQIELAASLSRFERQMAQLESRMVRQANTVEKKVNAQLSRVDTGATRAAANVNRVAGAMDATGQSAGRFGGTMQQVGFQVGDFATQVGAGTSATQALGQQLPQLLGAFGAFGALAGAGAAVLIPLSAALVRSAMDSKTLDERLSDLSKTTDAMTSAVEAAATPLSILRDRYGDLADEVQRANGAMAMMTTIRAQMDAIGAARVLSSPVGDITPVRPDGLSDNEWAAVQASIMDDLAKKTGASADQVDRLRMALNRTDSSNSLEAVAQDAESLLQVIADLYVGATDDQRRFLDTWAAQVAATMQSAKDQIAAGVAEESRLRDTYDKNAQEMKRLADDRAAAEAALAQAVKDGNQEKIDSYQRVLAAIDAEVRKINDSIATIDVSMGDFVSRMKARAAEITGSLMDAAGGFMDRYTGPGMGAIQTIKDFEGFQPQAYWDVNAYRAGFGSDTVTRADGSIERVTQDTIVTLADANRDLARRIGEFQAAIIGEVGPGRWSQFTQEQQAALTSIAYNYGSLPDRIIEAVRTGTSQDISTAIGRLAGDNGGINEGRRMREASAFGTTSAASSEYRASQQAAAEASRAAAENERLAAAGSDALERALEQAMQFRDVTAETVGVISAQESAWMAVGDSILSAVGASEDLDDALKNVALSLADMALQGAILGQGPLASLFGFSGGVRGNDALAQALRSAIGARAMGGPVSANTPYLVGERGPEIIVPRSAGRVIPNHQIGGGGGMTYAPTFHVGGRVTPEDLAAVRMEAARGFSDMQRTMPSRVASINRDPLRRSS